MAVEMAFKLAKDLQIENMMIEGDALNVIQNVTKATTIAD